MARIGLGSKGTIVNVVEDETDYVDPAGLDVFFDEHVQIGWNYANGALVVPPDSKLTLSSQVTAALKGFLEAGKIFNVADSGSPAVNVFSDGTETTIGVLAAFALFGQAFPNGTKSWTDNQQITTVLSAKQCVNLCSQVGAWADNVYAAAAELRLKINPADGTAPTITTLAQINSYAWPTS